MSRRCSLPALAACGEDRDQVAAERCRTEVAKALGAAAVAVSGAGHPALSDDPVYGWHLDIEVESASGGVRRRAGFRCLFEVAGREKPLFLAVLER